MLQKIFALLLIFSLGVFQPLISFADYTSKDVILAKYELEKTRKGKKYVEQLGVVIPNLPTQRLEEIEERVLNAKTKFHTLDGSKYDEIKALINYLEITISIELAVRQEHSLSDTQKQMVEKEIMYMQTSLKNDLTQVFDDILLAYNDLSHYEEKGDFDMNLSFDLENFGNFEAGISLSDYVSIVQGFDQTFVGDFAAFLEGNIDGEDLEISIGSSIDLISKDGIMYLQLDNINYKDHSQNDEISVEITPYIEKFEELARDNTYIQFFQEDQNLEMILGLVEEFSQDSVTERINEVLAEPLLEAYRQQSEGYLLRPTKHFCDTAKEVLKIFDPFAGNTCSDAQYQDMLNEFYSSGVKLLMEPGTTNTLTMSMIGEEGSYMKVMWNKSSISKVEIYAGDDSYYGKDSFSLIYIPKTSLNIGYSIENGRVTGDIDMKLARDGGVDEMTANIEFYEEYNGESVSIDVEYKNENLDANLDWNMGDPTGNCTLNGKLTSQFADLSGMCDVISPDLSYIIPGASSMKLSSDMLYDIRTGKNNLEFDFIVNIDEKNIFSMTLENIGTRKKASSKNISAPSKTILFEDIVSEIEGASWSDTGDYLIEDYDYCYSVEEVEYCDENTDEYYYDAYQNIYYYQEYQLDANTGEKTYY